MAETGVHDPDPGVHDAPKYAIQTTEQASTLTDPENGPKNGVHLQEPSGFFLRPLLMVCLNCGLRLDEALHLQWSDIDLAKALLHVRVKKGWSPKNHQPRSIPMNARLVAYLQERKEATGAKQSDLVCPRFASKGIAWTPQQVTHHVRKLWKAAGIYEKGKPTVHALRHTFATRYLLPGARRPE